MRLVAIECASFRANTKKTNCQLIRVNAVNGRAENPRSNSEFKSRMGNVHVLIGSVW